MDLDNIIECYQKKYVIDDQNVNLQYFSYLIASIFITY